MITLFLLGWATAIFVEYAIHRGLHVFRNTNHINHHKDFFKLPPKLVAELSDCAKADFLLITIFFAAHVPFALIWGWAPAMTVYAGMVWHLLIVYKTTHCLMHYHKQLPAFITRRRVFRWWQDCHSAHHHHAPRGNFCITFPPLDMLFGTFVTPRDSYPEDPSQD